MIYHRDKKAQDELSFVKRYTHSYITTTIKFTPRDVRTAAAGIASSCGFNGLFCIMKETKSPKTIEMLFARLLPFYSTIRWKLFLITTEQPLNRMTDPKVNMVLYSPIAGSFSHSSNVDIITSIFYRCK